MIREEESLLLLLDPQVVQWILIHLGRQETSTLMQASNIEVITRWLPSPGGLRKLTMQQLRMIASVLVQQLGVIGIIPNIDLKTAAKKGDLLQQLQACLQLPPLRVLARHSTVGSTATTPASTGTGTDTCACSSTTSAVTNTTMMAPLTMITARNLPLPFVPTNPQFAAYPTYPPAPVNTSSLAGNNKNQKSIHASPTSTTSSKICTGTPKRSIHQDASPRISKKSRVYEEEQKKKTKVSTPRKRSAPSTSSHRHHHHHHHHTQRPLAATIPTATAMAAAAATVRNHLGTSLPATTATNRVSSPVPPNQGIDLYSTTTTTHSSASASSSCLSPTELYWMAQLRLVGFSNPQEVESCLRNRRRRGGSAATATAPIAAAPPTAAAPIAASVAEPPTAPSPTAPSLIAASIAEPPIAAAPNIGGSSQQHQQQQQIQHASSFSLADLICDIVVAREELQLARDMDEARRQSEVEHQLEQERLKTSRQHALQNKLMQAPFSELLHPSDPEDRKHFFPRSWLLRYPPLQELLQEIWNEQSPSQDTTTTTTPQEQQQNHEQDPLETKICLLELLRQEKDVARWYRNGMPNSYFTYAVGKRLLECNRRIESDDTTKHATRIRDEIRAICGELKEGTSLPSKQNKDQVPLIFIQAQKEQKENYLIDNHEEKKNADGDYLNNDCNHADDDDDDVIEILSEEEIQRLKKNMVSQSKYNIAIELDDGV